MYYPSTSQASLKKALWLLSVLACAVYLVMKIPFYTEFRSIEPILVVPLIYFFVVSQLERKSFPTLMLFVAVFYSVIAWYIGIKLYPDFYSQELKTHPLTRVFLFLILGYFLSGDNKKTFIALTLATCSILITPWTLGGGFQEILQGERGLRIDFGIQNAQHTGMFFGVILIGCLSFFNRSLTQKKHALTILLIVFTACSSFGIFASQNRATALGLLTTLLFYTLVSLRKLTLRKKSIILVLGSLLATGLYLISEETLEKSDAENQRIEQMWDGDIKSISSTSIGARLNSWKAGYEWIKKSPLIGWGHDGGQIVAQNTDWLQGTYSSTFGHMHNSYIEMLVRYGFIGAAIFLILFIWIGIQLHQAYRHKVIDKDIYGFLLLSFIFMAVINLTESYFFYWTGSYLITLLTSICVTYIWKYQKLKLNGVLSHES